MIQHQVLDLRAQEYCCVRIINTRDKYGRIELRSYLIFIYFLLFCGILGFGIAKLVQSQEDELLSSLERDDIILYFGSMFLFVICEILKQIMVEDYFRDDFIDDDSEKFYRFFILIGIFEYICYFCYAALFYAEFMNEALILAFFTCMFFFIANIGLIWKMIDMSDKHNLQWHYILFPTVLSLIFLLFNTWKFTNTQI